MHPVVKGGALQHCRLPSHYIHATTLKTSDHCHVYFRLMILNSSFNSSATSERFLALFSHVCLLSVAIFTCLHTHTHTHTHTFNGPFSGTTRVGQYQKGKTNLDFTEARDSDWQWHQLGHMQVCTSLQTDNHASTSPLSFFTGRMPFLPPNQQRQSTEGMSAFALNADYFPL